jgi:xanthine/uracil permease
MALIFLFSLVLARRSRLFKLFPMLLAIVAAVTVCWLLSVAGNYEAGDPSFVDLSAAKASPWVRTNPSEVFFPWGLPKWDTGFFVAVLAGYLASMIESFGDYHACSHMAGGGDPTPQQISRGIGCEGIGCFLTGVFGGFSSTSYSENVGLIGLTKVGSRFVVQIGAVLLIALGLFGKFGALAAAIPGPVVGGVYCAMFGLISAVGVRQFARADLSSDRNLLIGGFALFMGLSVPAYFASVASPEGIQAGQTLATYQPTVETMIEDLPSGLAGIVKSIGTTGMAVAAILGILLDNLIPGTREERGLPPGVLVPEGGDVDVGDE